MDVSLLPDTRADAERLLGFIWHGQAGFYEVARQDLSRRYWARCPAELRDSLRDWTYFGPAARESRGSKRENVAAANVLWVDIDAPEETRERLRQLDLPPSAIVDSGNRGLHLYFKLDRLIAVPEIEVLNTALARCLKGDHCFDAPRVLRIPGAVNLKSGRRAALVALDATVFDPLEFWNSPVLMAADVPVGGRYAPSGVPVGLVGMPAYPKLAPEVWAYIETRPAAREGYDRSAMEMRIFTALAAQGWSDEEIFSAATVFGLPRHLEEVARGRPAWTLKSIAKARDYLLEELQIDTSPEGGPTRLLTANVEYPVGASVFGAGDPARYTQLPLGEFIWRVDGKTCKELIDEVRESSGHSAVTVKRDLKKLKMGGYVRTHRDPSDRRRVIYSLTDKALDAMTFDGHYTRGHNSLVVPPVRALCGNGQTEVGRSPLTSWRVHRPETVLK